MQGIIFDIKHYAIHDGPGIRTTIFFKGCVLRCWWCHNPECLLPEPQSLEVHKRVGDNLFRETENIGKRFSVEEIIEEIDTDTIFHDESNGGVTFSGGEPLCQSEFLIALSEKCKEKIIHTALDTSGFGEQTIITKLLPLIDLFLYDIKFIDTVSHIKYTGVSNIKIMENLNYLLSKNKKVIIRYPLIPDINNTKDELKKLAEFIDNRVSEIHFLPYHSLGNHKYQRLGIKNNLPVNLHSLSKEYLTELKTEFQSLGYKVKIGG